MKTTKQLATMLVLTLFGGWASPRALLAQHEWDNFSIGECLLVNLADTVPKFDTTPELISGLPYTCIAQGGFLTLTNPQSGQLQLFGGYNRKYEQAPGVGGAGEGEWGCPVPGDDSAWFLLAIGSDRSIFGNLDMRGDSTFGAATLRNVAFQREWTNIAGGAIVPHSDGFHYWFIKPGPVHPSNNEFDNYLIGPDGPSPEPVVSQFPLSVGEQIQIYGSPDGAWLAAMVVDHGVGVFHIDRATGKITLYHLIQTNLFPEYGGGSPYAFSPNGKVLYYDTYDHTNSISYILQYDLTRLNVSDTPYVVAESKDTNYNAFGSELALAGNGRIYALSNYTKIGKGGVPIGYFLSINSPDSIGPACHFDDTAFSTGSTSGRGIWNGIPRVVHSKLTQISAVSLPSCQSSCYSFSRPDSIAGFPHWSFDGGTPSMASGPVVPQVCFDSAGPHAVFAVTSSGDTLFTLAIAGKPSGGAQPLYDGMYDLYRQATDSANATVLPGSTVAIPIHLKLSYVNNPDQTGDTIGHLLREYVLTFDTSILSLPANPASALYLSGDEYEISSARQTGNTLTIIIGDTGGVESTTWWDGTSSGFPSAPWKDTMDQFRINFHTTNSSNWTQSKIMLTRFSIDDGFGSRLDFCPQENDLLATITNANAGVSQPSAPANITLYPNPTPGPITIRGAAGAVTVTNMLGESVMRNASSVMHNGVVELDLSGLPAGIYYARVETASGVVVRKIVKE